MERTVRAVKNGFRNFVLSTLRPSVPNDLVPYNPFRVVPGIERLRRKGGKGYNREEKGLGEKIINRNKTML